MEYESFIQGKHIVTEKHGIAARDINGNLFDWQATVVQWACKTGRAAIFADCGLGKTIMQLEWARQMSGDGEALILTPLAVAEQTLAEHKKFGIQCAARIVSTDSDIGPGINIANYERLHKFNAARFRAVVLDESSILKSYMGKTKQQLLKAFADTPYRLACTATPAPNDHLELGNHCQFLGHMDSYEMIARWFQNDLMCAGKYTLKPHAAKDFWKWVSTWAVSLSTPSDIGGCDEGYKLPKLNVEKITIAAPLNTATSDALFVDGDLSATALHKEKRRTCELRADRAAEIAKKAKGPVIVWCDTDYEADALIARMPEAVEVRGSHKDEDKRARLAAFTSGEKRIIITKPEIAGFGLNWQHCADVIFVGLSYSFERFYQAVRRSYRFGQKRQVNVYVIEADTESAIAANVSTKAIAHESLKNSMTQAMKDAQMDEIHGRRRLIEIAEPVKHEGDRWTLFEGDCVKTASKLEDNSIHLSVYSPPFENLYVYSDSMADMGNSKDSDEFFAHYIYLIREMYRITMPGRLSVVHCKDLPAYMGRDGAAGLKDFPGKIIQAHEACGWQFHSRVTIWKDPVIEMQRTKNHGLLHKSLCDDSCNSRQGMADYLVVFRKWDGKDEGFPEPVQGHSSQVRFKRGEYVGEDAPHWQDSDRLNSINVWQRYASPVWFDIRQTNVLQYREARNEDDTKHICPLQLDVIERSIHLWSNPGDLVMSPFTGIGSEGYCAVKMNRRFVGSELKPEYCKVAVKNLRKAERMSDVGADLFVGSEDA